MENPHTSELPGHAHDWSAEAFEALDGPMGRPDPGPTLGWRLKAAVSTAFGRMGLDIRWRRPPADLRGAVAHPADAARLAPGSSFIMDVPVERLRLTHFFSAVREAGQRAVLHSGWTGMGGENLPEGVFSIDYAPYDWLFPRMAGLVIHGGAGSGPFALGSRPPPPIVPVLFEPRSWAPRFSGLGVWPPPLAFRKLTSIRLADSIHALVTNASMAEKAAAVASVVRQEPGISEAVRIIESI